MQVHIGKHNKQTNKPINLQKQTNNPMLLRNDLFFQIKKKKKPPYSTKFIKLWREKLLIAITCLT